MIFILDGPQKPGVRKVLQTFRAPEKYFVVFLTQQQY
jgi:hypothetical protein